MRASRMNRKVYTSEQIHTALTGYQSAVDLWAHAGDEVWARFNVMLVANSIIIAAIRFSSKSDEFSPIINLIFSAGGLALCFLWLLILRRGLDYQQYYILSAKEIESVYLSKEIRTIHRGGDFADGKEIVFHQDSGIPQFAMCDSSKFIKAKTGACAVVYVFAFLYCIIILNTGYTILNSTKSSSAPLPQHMEKDETKKNIKIYRKPVTPHET